MNTFQIYSCLKVFTTETLFLFQSLELLWNLRIEIENRIQNLDINKSHCTLRLENYFVYVYVAFQINIMPMFLLTMKVFISIKYPYIS